MRLSTQSSGLSARHLAFAANEATVAAILSSPATTGQRRRNGCSAPRGLFAGLTKTVFQAAILAATVGLGSLASAQEGFRVMNDTDRPVNVVLLYEQSGGHDGLGGPGSWSGYKSIGWFRIGAYQDRVFDGRPTRLHIAGERVDMMGLALSTIRDPKMVKSYYVHPQDAFEYRIYTRDSTGEGRDVSSVEQALNAGAALAAFVPISAGQDSFYIRNAQPMARARFSMQDSLFVRGSGAEWVEQRRNGPPAQFQETQRDGSFVELYDPSREMWVRLYPDRGLWWSNTSPRWSPWTGSEGSWLE